MQGKQKRGRVGEQNWMCIWMWKQGSRKENVCPSPRTFHLNSPSEKWFHFHALEKEMATHSSVLTWKIPGTEKPGGLLFVGSHRAGHDWSDLAVAAAVKSASVSHSVVVAQLLWPHGLVARQAPLFMEFSRQEHWSHSLLQERFLTQGSNSGLLHCRKILHHLSHQGSPKLS